MRVEKSWGYEQILTNGEYCCKLLVYTKTVASSLHYHEKKHETFVCQSGCFVVSTDTQDMKPLVPGGFMVIPPGTRHRVRCLEPGVIVEASTHDDPEDCIRLIPSE